MARKGGTGRKKRALFRKNIKAKGKFSFRNYLASFKEGDKVFLTVESSVREGIFNPRFIGKQGTVIGSQGSCYIVLVKDIKKEKQVIVHPVHLRRAN